MSLSSLQASDLLEFGEGFCDITCHQSASFKSWPAPELDRIVQMLRESFRRVQSGTLSNAKFEDIQQACGLHFNALGFLASDQLRAHCNLLQVVTFDWVHTLLQDGCFVLEASLVITACGDHVPAILGGWRIS